MVYSSAGNIRQTLSLGDSVGTMGSSDLCLLDASDSLVNLDYADAIALVDGDGDGDGEASQFISWQGNRITPTAGPATGMTSTDIGDGVFGQSFETADHGASYYNQTAGSPGNIPCFAEGTQIETPVGSRPIETFVRGDVVRTADGRHCPIRWASRRAVNFRDEPELRPPIRIAHGALGPGRPAADLVVSAQHRIAVGALGQLCGLFSSPALVPAQALVGLRGIREMRGKRGITWHHLLLDTHDLLSANGAVAESLLPGPMVRNGLSRGHRLRIAPLLAASAPALSRLTVGQARRLLARGRNRISRP